MGLQTALREQCVFEFVSACLRFCLCMRIPYTQFSDRESAYLTRNTFDDGTHNWMQLFLLTNLSWMIWKFEKKNMGLNDFVNKMNKMCFWKKMDQIMAGPFWLAMTENDDKVVLDRYQTECVRIWKQIRLSTYIYI